LGLVLATGAVVLALAPPAVAAPSLIGTSSVVASGASSLRLTTPRGLLPGDVFVASISARLRPRAAIVAPPGWRRIRRDIGAGTAPLTQVVYMKVAGPAEPPVFRWRFSSRTTVAAGLLDYRGVVPTSPIEAQSGGFSHRAKPQLIHARSAKASAGALLIGFYATSGGASTAPPRGMRELYDVHVSRRRRLRVSAEAAHTLQDVAGSTGARNAVSASSNSTNIGQLVVLRPLPDSAPRPPVPPAPPSSFPPRPPPRNPTTPRPFRGGALPPALPPSTGTAYYISPTGSDANTGTAAAPWRTVQKALDTLRPGERAYVHAGAYAENLFMSRAGTPDAPITIQNYPGEQPVLRPGLVETNNIPLQVGRGAAYVRFHGLTIEGATGPSTANVYVSGNAHDVELSECEIRGSQRQGFFSEATTASIHVVACYVHDNGGSGPVQLDHNLYVQGHGHVIADCLVANAPNGFGIQIYPSSDRVIVTENTIVGALRDGIIMGGDGARTTSNAAIVNNVIAFNGRYGISTYWGDGAVVGANNIATTNIVWANAAGSIVGIGIGDLLNILADPFFVDRAAGNYHLQSTSPALDRGLPLYTLGTDLAGVGRPQGAGPDIGAYERT